MWVLYTIYDHEPYAFRWTVRAACIDSGLQYKANNNSAPFTTVRGIIKRLKTPNRIRGSPMQ